MDIRSALTIAGSDSCGGAGIQADLKTFTMLGVYGMSVVTAITAQNTLGVQAAMEIPVNLVRKQFESVSSDIVPAAVKTGMLASVEMINVVAELLGSLTCPYVCDPVMVSKSGVSLVAPDAAAAIRERLLPIARVVTPNRYEVRQLLGRDVATIEEAASAARELAAMGPGAVIIKGLEQGERMADLVLVEGEQHIIDGKRHPAGRSHGSGCTFSAAITAELAKGSSLLEAARIARSVIDAAIGDSFMDCRGVRPVNVMAYRG